jgi:hypothetical protein
VAGIRKAPAMELGRAWLWILVNIIWLFPSFIGMLPFTRYWWWY